MEKPKQNASLFKLQVGSSLFTYLHVYYPGSAATTTNGNIHFY